MTKGLGWQASSGEGRTEHVYWELVSVREKALAEGLAGVVFLDGGKKLDVPGVGAEEGRPVAEEKLRIGGFARGR